MTKFTPQEIHDLKLTLSWLEKETPEKWAVGVLLDYHTKNRCILGHLINHHCSSWLIRAFDNLVEDLPESQYDGINARPGIHCLNNNLGGNKRAILDVLWGLLKGVE